LRHMDDILGIKEIDVIQWEPGAGQQPTWGWIELLQKIQKAGKGLWLYGWPPEAVKTYYKELKPEGLIFYLWADSPKNAEDMVKWFKDNT
ncbi:MAG: hypothetical protein FWE82_10305, partial [Defluviitaleaceae bacterium]|nr:hypothetical protein [Defluviitaleaceae bacterium]